MESFEKILPHIQKIKPSEELWQKIEIQIADQQKHVLQTKLWLKMVAVFLLFLGGTETSFLINKQKKTYKNLIEYPIKNSLYDENSEF